MNKEERLEQVVNDVVAIQDQGANPELFGFARLAAYLGLPHGETVEMFDSWTESYEEKDWRPYTLGLIYAFFDKDED